MKDTKTNDLYHIEGLSLPDNNSSTYLSEEKKAISYAEDGSSDDFVINSDGVIHSEISDTLKPDSPELFVIELSEQDDEIHEKQYEIDLAFSKTQLTFIGKGGFNMAYLSKDTLSIEGYTGQWVFKSAINTGYINSIDRAIRKWRTHNPEYPALIVTGGWIAPYLGNTPASDEQIHIKVIEIYRNTGEIIGDACGANNFLVHNGKVVCVDMDLSLRRGSFATENYFNNNFSTDILTNYLNKFENKGYSKTTKIIKTLLYIESYLPQCIYHNRVTLSLIKRLSYFRSKSIPLSNELMDLLIKIDQCDPDHEINSKLLTKESLEILLEIIRVTKIEKTILNKELIIKVIHQDLLKLDNWFNLLKDGFLDEIILFLTKHGHERMVNEVNIHGISPLEITLIHGHEVIANYLIDNGAIIKTPQNGVRHAIHYASSRGLLGITQRLLKHEPTLANLNDCKNQTPLMWAASNGQIDIITFLLQLEEININAQTSSGLYAYSNFSALDWAINKGHANAAALLIKHNAISYNRHVKFGNHSLYELIINNDLTGIEILTQNNPELFNMKTSSGHSPLDTALQAGHIEVVRYLLQNDVLIYELKPFTTHSIHYAAYSGMLDAIQEILIMDKNLLLAKDSNGMNPLHCAAVNGHINIVKFLIYKNKDIINQPIITSDYSHYIDYNNFTALDLAITKGHISTSSLLMKSGATTFIQHNKFNSNTLRQLIKTCQISSIKILIEHNPSLVFMRGSDGLTPLESARKYRDRELENLFIGAMEKNNIKLGSNHTIACDNTNAFFYKTEDAERQYEKKTSQSTHQDKADKYIKSSPASPIENKTRYMCLEMCLIS